MDWLDALIVIVFIFFIATAFTAGFLRETVAMASSIAAVLLAGLFYDDVAENVLTSIDNQATAYVVGFLVVLVGVTALGQGITILLRPAVSVMQLGVLDQVLGAGFGAVKAFVLIEILLFLFVAYPRWDIDDRIRESGFASVMLDASRPMLEILPAEFETKVDQFTGD
jgi:membrane protein required for colicin V production